MSVYDDKGNIVNGNSTKAENVTPENEGTIYTHNQLNKYSRIIPDSTKNPNLNLDVIQAQTKLKKENTEHKDGNNK